MFLRRVPSVLPKSVKRSSPSNGSYVCASRPTSCQARGSPSTGVSTTVRGPSAVVITTCGFSIVYGFPSIVSSRTKGWSVRRRTERHSS